MSKEISFLGLHKAQTVMDTVLACCYSQRCFKKLLVSDEEYDFMRAMARERNPKRFADLMARPVWDYPSRIRDLAHYLTAKVEQRK